MRSLYAPCCLLCLFFPAPVWAGPVISEFMASNQNGIVDENGTRPDWIEIRNPDAVPVLMTGWSLTDNEVNPGKWTFPAMEIPANGYLLIFASGKDRRVAGQPLHTNFSLQADGEYLALVRPDRSPASQWSPAYPKQYANISYGTSTSTSEITWIQQSTAVRAMVAADTSLIPQWRSIGFNDAGWSSGTFGVGYFNSGSIADLGVNFGTGSATPMNGANTGRHSYSRAVFNVADRNAVVSLKLRMNYDDGFVAWINGTLAANSPNAPTVDPISPTALVAGHGPGAFEDFALPPAAVAALVSGVNVLAIEGMNTTTSSSDALIIPQLIGSLDAAAGQGVTGYFTLATPGTANGGVNTIQLPGAVQFSRPAGTFSDPFNLALGGAGPGQEIRYIITDPAGSANIVEPGPAATLYVNPIPISGSKLIRAAIYEGSQRSSTFTAQYLLLETTAGPNNTSAFSSVLPIIVMDDHGAGQPVDSGGNSYTTTMMHVFPTVNGIARLADSLTGNGLPVVFSRAGTRVRGSSSAGLPKKSYGMETWDEGNRDKDVSLLGLAADSDWILNGPATFDDTYIHNAYINEISRRIGRWAPRTVACEVFFNQNGGKLDYADYAGVYILTEKIKSSSQRLDITGLGVDDNAGAALTGGYIFKIDRPDSGEYAWTINNAAYGLGTLPNQESGQALVLVEPDPDFDTVPQQAYLQTSTILPWNNTLFTERAAAFSTRSYRTHIDTASFVDHHLLNSLAYNVDALRLSAFYFKDRNGKIQAGPIWDFDRSLGSDDGRDSNPSSWGNIGYFFDRDWWGALFKDPQFVQQVVDRWWELRQPGRPFQTTALHLLADQMGGQIGNDAGARDAARWPTNAAAGGVYLNEIAALKTWLTSRGIFMDNAMPGPPAASPASGPVSAGSTVVLSGSGTIRYTLNGTDPRPADGSIPGLAPAYTGPLTLNSTTIITARRQVNTTPFPNGAVGIAWSAPRTQVYLVDEAFAITGDLALSKINYNPAGPTPVESALAPGVTNQDFEWIELRNIGPRSVNTFQMSFPAGFPGAKEMLLSARTLAPGGTALVVKNRAAFEARYGTSQNPKIVAEWVEGNLEDNGEALRLLARDGSTVASFAYSDGAGWPDRADGKGAALEYQGVGFSTAEYETAANWRSTSEIHGNPGNPGSGPDTRIVINEILSHSNLPRVDAIELYNPTNSAVDLGNWFLSDTGNIETVLEYQKFMIPPGTVIPSGGYVVFTEQDFNPNGAWNPAPGVAGLHEFAFDGQRGDDAWLVSNTGGKLRFTDHVDFGAARPDETWGRLPNGTGPLVPMNTRTLLKEQSILVPQPGEGASNSGIRTGPLIIQEIHHAPPGGDPDFEFVEIFNPGGPAVTLNGWRLRGDVDFNFSEGSIAGGGILVLVPFSPADAVRAGNFRATYGIDSSVPLAGPWNSGDQLSTHGKVTLYRAEPSPANGSSFIPYTIEDEINYLGNTAPWPDTTAGLSLQRNIRQSGSSAASWFADLPTPGDQHLSSAYWKTLYFPTGGNGSNDHDDPDLDSLDNTLEFAFGTLPQASNDPAAVLPSISSQANVSGGVDYFFTWTRPRNIRGVTYTVQKSTDLRDWTTLPHTLVGTTQTTETHRASINSAGQTRILMKLLIIITP